TFHQVLIRDEGEPPWNPKLDLFLRETESVILWGQRDPEGEFFEGRIPGKLAYPDWAPVSKSGRLAIKIQRYRCEVPVPILTESESAQKEPRPVFLFRCIQLVPAVDA